VNFWRNDENTAEEQQAVTVERTDEGFRAIGQSWVVEDVRSGRAGRDLALVLAAALERGEKRGWSVVTVEIPAPAISFIVWHKGREA
jgi:hypothetical protein